MSPDNLLVYVTLDDGRLEVLSAFDGARRWGYKPQSIDAAAGWTVRCQSGVYFGKLPTGMYAIYAVIDVAPSGSLMDDQSRIIAVSHPNNALMWESESIPGQIQGTPLITYSAASPGKYIMFTHNQKNVSSGSTYGTFSMVQADANGTLIFSEDAGDSRLYVFFSFFPSIFESY